MKLIIDINENVYTRLLDNGRPMDIADGIVMERAIRNGTPIPDLETRDYIFKIGDRGKAIQARYDKNTDTLIFPRVAFDYVCDLLKEALSQEPCEDAISREAVLDYLKSNVDDFPDYHEAIEKVLQMSSVTQKSGMWITEEIGEGRKVYCSECEESAVFEYVRDGDIYSSYGHGVVKKTKYCPNCGAKMVEPQESEVRNETFYIHSTK